VRDASGTAARGPRKEANVESIPEKDVLETGIPYIREAASHGSRTSTLETFIRRDFLFVSLVLLTCSYCK
jgi:hypothetical protein